MPRTNVIRRSTKDRQTLTQAYIHNILDYDKNTGIFSWKTDRSNKKAGDIAGSKAGNYIRITIDDIVIRAHHLAWFYMNGVWINNIDHEDRNKSNNAISNLRLATNAENSMNAGVRKNSTSGVTGVYTTVRKKRTTYRSTVTVNNKSVHLGTFKTLSEAIQARKDAEVKYFGSFAPK